MTTLPPLKRRACLLAGAVVLAPAYLVAAPRKTAAPAPAPQATALPQGSVGPVPASLRLSKLYTQYTDAGGVPVVASSHPVAQSLLAARAIVLNMLVNRADLLAALSKAGIRVAVIGAAEVTTDIPEYATLVPAGWWNSRTRGVGATAARPVSSAGEENLLGLAGDRYVGESIMVHEFGHTLFEMGVRKLDRGADQRLDQIYQKAMAAGLWQNTYAATNYREYWAEGVQCWFDANPRGLTTANGIHAPVATREGLQQYDPALASFIAGVFGKVAWRWDRPGLHASR